MRLQDFHLEIIDWGDPSQRGAVETLRAACPLPADRATRRTAGAEDAAAWHVAARDGAGRIVGAARLQEAREIDCLFVHPDFRARGVGSALLHALFEHAGTRGNRQIQVCAQTCACGFFTRAGFAAAGEPFSADGAAWQILASPVAAGAPVARPARDHGILAAGNRSLVAAARRQILADARHQLAVYVPALDGDWFTSVEELAELRRIGSSGRAASIRIVLHDAAGASAGGHPLVPLAQRLPSAFAIRSPVDEADLAYPGAYLLNDVGGYLYLPLATRAAGRAARCHPAAQAPLRQHHASAWERALPATILNVLDL